jgi:transposase
VEEHAVAPAKKNAKRRHAWLVFEDESGVSQHPVVRRTWAPRGETPILLHTGGNWKRLSVAGALAYRWDGRRSRFFFHTRAGTYTDRALVPFVRALKRHFRGRRIVLIWDGLGGHTSRYMTTYVRRQRAWLTVERLPAYAPELNPIEQVWGNVKTRELANVCAPDLASLRQPLRCGFARIRQQPTLARAFLHHAGLSF